MADALNDIKTVVLLMFENRSFDHLLGHLSYQGINPAIDGFKDPLSQYENLYQGDVYNPYRLLNDGTLSFDLPHEYDYVDIQLAKSGVTQRFMMSGFVDAYARATGVNPNPQTDPMGFFGSDLVPISSFLANTFCACERWFSSLPTSTQPNRTIAFTGDSSIFETKNQLIDINDSLFDWMNRAGVNWRVYHDGFSFFSLYPKLWKYVLSDKFRDYEDLHRDMLNERLEDTPQVIIVEPSYQDGPHIGPDHPNDNHAPLAIGWGEDFLRRTYQSITANAEKWGNTLMVVYYDEHGGFYDHVSPPLIPYQTMGNTPHVFNSLGPRIPGIIISPFVKRQSVSNAILDHTSVLQFLAEKFTPGTPYSSSVSQRSGKGISSISVALANEPVLSTPAPPSQGLSVSSVIGDSIAKPPTQAMGQAFELSARQLLQAEPDAVSAKFPELLQWRDAVDQARKA
jgi:phospholipase C